MELIKEKNHLGIIDLMRGIASLSVCIFHLSINSSYYGNYLSEANIIRQIGQYGWLGVQVFFVISGFIIPYSLYKNQYHYKNFLGFLKKRWLRIEPPYIVTIFLILANWAFNAWLWSYPLVIDWVQVVLHFFYLPQFFGYPWINEIFWTLAQEFQFYLFMALFFPLFVHSKKWIRILSIVGFALPHFFYVDDRILTSHSSLFLAGIIVFLYWAKYLSKIECAIFLLLDILYIVYQFPDNGIKIAAAGGLSALCILFLRSGSAFGTFTGKISYSLYLTHGLIGGNFLFFSMYVGFIKEYESVRMIMVILAILLSVVFALLFNKFVEQPSQLLSKKVKYN